MRIAGTFALFLLCSFSFTYGQLTTAEQTGYTSTSTHAEVMNFLNEITYNTPYARVDTLAISTEGRMIPLLVIGNPLPHGPEDLKDDNRIVVYLQANIHAGEVEGKEASLMLARQLLENPDPEYLNNLVILICPVFNADGNDKISTQNRTNQNGPKNGVGVRYNGQQLDLNRDAMKAESPEMRGLITRVFNGWDPAVTVDCHTTNGSYHEKPVTFTWMMNPNGDRDLINFMRDDMMPAVSEQLRDVYKVPNVFYGEFIDFKDYQKGWVSYASEPRYLVNYVGVRNRLAILNENYVYADFKTRVMGCYYLLWSILDYSAEHKEGIRKAIEAADALMINRWNDPARTDSFAIEYESRPTPEPVTIHAFEVIPNPEPNVWPYFKPTENKVTVTVPYIADYYSTRNIAIPYAYVVDVADPIQVGLLKIHGIRLEKLKDTITLEVEQFNLSELKPSERLNQGHYTNTVKGEYKLQKRTFPPGTYVVRTDQPLGNLAAYLLEPQSDDSMLLWNFFDRYLVPQWGRGFYPYPVYRLAAPLSIETLNIETSRH